jgi:hypothetical protein
MDQVVAQALTLCDKLLDSPRPASVRPLGGAAAVR